MQVYAGECTYRHANGVVSRFALEGLAYSSTAGSREYFACGKGLNDDGESRRPDWQKARQMAGFR